MRPNLLPQPDSVNILTVAHAFRPLSKWTCIRRVVKRRIDNQLEEGVMAKYLSEALKGNLVRDRYDASSLWAQARNACRRLNIIIGAQFHWFAKKRDSSPFSSFLNTWVSSKLT